MGRVLVAMVAAIYTDAFVAGKAFHLAYWEQIMIDDQVNLEELEESRKRRTAQETTAEGSTPGTPEGPVHTPYRKPKQWISEARKWLGVGGRTG